MEVSLKSFLLEEARFRRGGKGGRAVFLAAFGKHPGWDDHIDDIGLQTESLVAAKRSLYVQGIGGQVNGRWGGMTGDQLRPGFGHTWLWQRGDRFLMGRLWSSTDGQGRGEYPMVVCCHCVGLSLPWAVKNLLPRLGEIETESGRVRTAAELRALVARHQAAMVRAVEILDEVEPAPEVVPGKAELLGLFLREVGEDGLLRVLYEMENKLGAAAGNKVRSPALTTADPPRHFRVPSLAADLDRSLLFWSAMMSRRVGRDIPALSLFPVGESWADVIVGDPSADDFVCLRASRQAVPVASDIPYQFKPDFLDRAQRWLAEFREATTLIEARTKSAADGASSEVDAPVTKDPTGKDSGRRLLWMVLLVLPVILGAVWLWHSAANRSSDSNAAEAPEGPGDTNAPIPAQTSGPAPREVTESAVDEDR